MKIVGLGHALPDMCVNNDELSKFLDTNDEWISTRTGIKERRLVRGTGVRELAAKASQDALRDAGIGAGDLDMILCSTVLTEYITPAMACVIQGDIGAFCPAVDINGACAGFLYALDMADAYIRSGKMKNILIVCAENVSRMADWTDRSTCVLFGDGVGAAVVTAGDSLKAIKLACKSDDRVLIATTPAGNSPFLDVPGQGTPLYMNGQEVFKFAVSQSTSDIREMLEKTGYSCGDIAYFVLHQANMRIVLSVAQKLAQPPEKFPHNVERYGNTSSASIPILLSEMKQAGQLKNRDMLILSAFGAGLVSGACVLEWQE